MSEYKSIERDIIKLYNEAKWQNIIKFTDTMENFSGEKFRLFWVLPSESDLSFMDGVMKNCNVSGIASIGCGCGLFEWLLQQYSGLPVLGIEVDESWWCSKYAPPRFLRNIAFVSKTNAVLQVSREYALLFCYFNNGKAFSDYIDKYKGRLVFVIGPEEGQSRTTDPMPVDQKFEEFGWTLVGRKKIAHSNDCITAYNRGGVCN